MWNYHSESQIKNIKEYPNIFRDISTNGYVDYSFIKKYKEQK